MNIYFERNLTKKEKRKIGWSALYFFLSSLIIYCTLPQKNKAKDCFIIPEFQNATENSYTIKKECIEYIISSITLFDQFMHIVKLSLIVAPLFLVSWLTIYFIKWINEQP
ncbi:hypothetical protein [Pseudomonas sp. RT6P73]